jgi:molecular chaperone DnaK (HSP70)
VTARYSVGIDLGTTNSAMAEVDLAVEPAGPGEPLPAPVAVEVPQVVSPGEAASRELLPSFVYLPSPHEAQKGAFALPWGDAGHVVGAYARDRGAQVPGRLVSSAKSWLSHPGVDKRGQLLPPGAEAEVPRISPVEASARILSHLRAAWDAAHEDDKLADQAVTLTVPASFDAVARELTVQAAAQAGLGTITLLEEPQAALYAWVRSAGETWRKIVHPGDVILVVDIGGGTSDFSLIGVGEEDGRFSCAAASRPGDASSTPGSSPR